MPKVVDRIVHDVVAAAVWAVVAERCPPDERARWPVENEVTAHVLEQLARMPDWTRGPLRALLLLLDASTLPGRPFHARPHTERWRALEAWRRSRLGPRRDLVRLLESLAVHGWHAARWGRLAARA